MSCRTELTSLLVHLFSLLQYNQILYFILKDQLSCYHSHSVFVYVRSIVRLLLTPYIPAFRKKRQNIHKFLQEAETLVRSLLSWFYLGHQIPGTLAVSAANKSAVQRCPHLSFPSRLGGYIQKSLVNSFVGMGEASRVSKVRPPHGVQSLNYAYAFFKDLKRDDRRSVVRRAHSGFEKAE